jgi:lipid-A-disaccharide synthase
MALAMRILIVAGETSGDHYGTCLSRELKQLDPTTLLWRVGSEPIGLSGEELIASSQQLAVIGWMDSATRAARAAKIFTKILRVVRTHKIDAAVLIDSPAFNLKLAKALKKGGVRVFYYVSPQIWAWGQRRIKTIRKWVEHLFVLFPFEAALYAREGIAATYVGHPLFDRPFPKQSKFELRSDFFPGAVATGPGGSVYGTSVNWRGSITPRDRLTPSPPLCVMF